MGQNSTFHLYITGVPGTGKTCVAKRISNLLSLEYLELNTIVLENGLYLGYDINRDSVILDEPLIVSHLESLLANKKRLCLVGGVVIQLNSLDLIIVLRCDINVLRQRLFQRNYSEEKIQSNLEAEIMNVVYYDTIDFFPKLPVIEIHNDKHSIEETCNQIISVVRKHHPSVFERIFD
ncbi:MAG: adenylate kinase family protein [Candidatus Hodarchaeales archaeon]|jgi:adenylate kinase